MSKNLANGLVLGAAVVSLLLLLLAPGMLTGLIAIAAVGLTAYLRASMPVRALALALLTLGLTLALARGAGGDILFIGLVAVLVSLITIPHVPGWIKGLLGAAILLISIPIAGFANSFLFELGIQIGIYAAMALGLNVVVGMAGLLDLGYAAFFAIGAYTWAIFGSPQANQFTAGGFPLNGNFFYLFMAIAVVTTAITGLLIGLPALRLRGDYLAIVTLGLGEVVRVLANNLDHPVNLTNGPQGITPVERPGIDWFRSLMSSIGIQLDAKTDYQLFFYLLVLVIIGIVITVNLNLGNSR
ncbi:MAG TPA: branched-chain amino acid ABC transporter permease, partial [Meiothermus sp.]|nr:branched-chain amino acid ABC transporter permease [Meiothermus sp.]